MRPGQWYHVSVTGNKSGYYRLYINGREDAEPAEINKSYFPYFFDRLYIGSVIERGRVEGFGPLNGAVADIARYDRALTDEEIGLIYESITQ